ncbi:MAG: Thiazole synthase [Alphaproteobacteria bacterium MarineAlpha6_Bin4]|nr:MAG: Thiazole synthase [Alphaproteobacteria bacterium MarineAlpha6_Bin3]PPR37900.1 MAG: Thiazole synthase [Alphaproteobacteria bacterium MarineAlpha6_Bin4]|tara:strand:- start:4102 stop:4884 length:783 start_codon:yes stop_codon:yes gene_type:complete
MSEFLKIANKKFKSRLFMGTSRYPNQQIMLDSLEAGKTEVVTVAIRRISLKKYNENIIDILKKKYFILPNTAGCYTVKEAVLTAELAREALKTNFVKLEVIGNEDDLLPDIENLLPAARELVKKKFNVLPYCNDDPVVCKKLEDIGCSAVMPLAAPIGSGLGIQNKNNIEFIVRQSNVPVIIDAGVGTASDVAIAMELGCDGVLLNTAVAEAEEPTLMAKAMAEAINAGRNAFLAGRMPKRLFAKRSTTNKGRINIVKKN